VKTIKICHNIPTAAYELQLAVSV